MEKRLNEYINLYKAELEKGDIRIAYESLIKYVMALKAHFNHTYSYKYSVGNVSPGYLDYTYFPYFNDFLRNKKLRFGIVLNHQNMRFELWLMGQNEEVHKQYWEILKATKWNVAQKSMPKYSVLETVLVEEPDFDDLDALSTHIISIANAETEEIMKLL